MSLYSAAPAVFWRGDRRDLGARKGRRIPSPRRSASSPAIESGLPWNAASAPASAGAAARAGLKTALFRRNDGGAAFEMGQFQKQNALIVPAGGFVFLLGFSRRIKVRRPFFGGKPQCAPVRQRIRSSAARMAACS